MRLPCFITVLAFSTLSLFAADGDDSFQTRCAVCHGGDGAGTDRARSILPTIHSREPDQLATIITKGVSSKGMPAFEMPAEELSLLIAHLKKLAEKVSPAARDPRAPQMREGTLPMAGGGSLSGVILNESGFDAQLRTADGKIHLLRRVLGSEGDAYREPTLEPYADWSSYNGSDSSNRHSPLDQINRDTVGKLAAGWFYPIRDMSMIEGTPVVIAGVMYVTAVNQVFALDAATGREIWRYSQPRTPGLVGDPGIGLNRGVAVRGEWFQDGDRIGNGQADYYGITGGVNYSVTDWLKVRPEVRYDWSSVDAFDGGDDQFLVSTDLVITF